MDPFYAFLAFALLIVLETLASQSGLAAYFRIGLPLFIARRSAAAPADLDAYTAVLNERLQEQPGQPRIDPRVLSDTEIALRERLFDNRAGARYLPVMHSLLRFDPTNRQVTLVGFLNLYAAAAAAYAGYRTTQDQTFLPVAVLIFVLLVLSYLLQSSLYRRVLDAASERPATGA